MKEYMEEFEVSYYATNTRGKLTQNSLMEYFQDVAIRHSDSLGYTIEFLSGQGRGWVLTNSHIVVDRYPECGERIRIKTWSSSCRRLQAERSFIIENEAGVSLIKSVSRWVFMDLERRRPTPIPGDMEEKYYCGIEAAIEAEKFFMPKDTGGNQTGQFSFYVRRSETDTNGHTNNTKYVAWAMDMVSDDIYESKDNFDISVVFRKECYKGSLVLAKSFTEQVEGVTKINTYFFDGKDESIIFCQVVTLWR